VSTTVAQVSILFVATDGATITLGLVS